jgi:DNA-binding transcriptional MocR family regulator
MIALSKTASLVDRIAAQIADGRLRPGDQLPSIRSTSAAAGLAKNTVVEAYLRLAAMGLVESRAGSGYRVRQAAPRRTSVSASPAIVEAVDLFSLLREQLDRHYDVRPGDARPPAAWIEELESAPRGRAGQGHRSLRLEDGVLHPWGFKPLRERLAETLADRAVGVGDGQILLTNGGNHALDLIARHFVRPGDAVLVDDPGYYPLFGKLKLAGATIVGIPRTPSGPDLTALEAAASRGPVMFFTQSLAHNPSGGDISPGCAYGLLQLAERYNFRVVESDPFADVLASNAPRLAALDQLKRVIYVGTFSKTLSATLRVGFIAASPSDTAALADLKMVTITATSDHPERIIHELMRSGQYLRHLRRLRTRLDKAHDDARTQFRRFGVTLPEAEGLYLWLTFPDGTNEAELCRRASAESIFMAPGRVFAADKGDRPPATRMNVAHATHPHFLSFLKRTVFR